MKFHRFSFIMGIVLGIIVVGLVLGLKVTSQNKIIQEKEREIVNLQNTISTNQQEFQKLQSEISKAGEQIKKQSEAEEQMKKQMEYNAQPDLPIRVSVRNALTSNTKVLQLTNYSKSAIRVNVSFNFEGKTQLRTVDLTPNLIRELGQKEGFPFKSGDSVTIEATGYRSITKSLR